MANPPVPRAAAQGSFPRPSVAVDLVILTADGGAPNVAADTLSVLLIRRGEPPFLGRWALPGGFLRVGAGDVGGESLEQAAQRELTEETGLRARDVYLEQLGAFGAPERDPRTRVVSVAYYALVRPTLTGSVRAGGDASAACWRDARAPGRLAFDHAEMLQATLRRIEERLGVSAVIEHLLSEQFTINELRRVHEIVTGAALDAGNFRRKVQAMLTAGVLEATAEQRATRSKPAALYRFTQSR